MRKPKSKASTEQSWPSKRSGRTPSHNPDCATACVLCDDVLVSVFGCSVAQRLRVDHVHCSNFSYETIYLSSNVVPVLALAGMVELSSASVGEDGMYDRR